MPGTPRTPENNYSSAKPAGTDKLFDSDDFIRANFSHIDNAYQEEHYAPSNDPDASESDFGRHDFITLKEQASKPSLVGLTTRHALYAKADGIYIEEDDGTEALLFSFTTNKVPQASVDLDATDLLTPGMICAFGRATAPSGWLICDGSAVSRTTYADLFAVIGTNYGYGDNSTTFNLPDLRGKFPRGVDGAAGNDPNAATRTAQATGGNTGDNVGSIQAAQTLNLSHNHIWYTGGGSSNGLLYNSSGNATGITVSTNGYDGVAAHTVGNLTHLNQSFYTGNANPASGVGEIRPINVYVNYCIKT